MNPFRSCGIVIVSASQTRIAALTTEKKGNDMLPHHDTDYHHARRQDLLRAAERERLANTVSSPSRSLGFSRVLGGVRAWMTSLFNRPQPIRDITPDKRTIATASGAYRIR